MSQQFSVVALFQVCSYEALSSVLILLQTCWTSAVAFLDISLLRDLLRTSGTMYIAQRKKYHLQILHIIRCMLEALHL